MAPFAACRLKCGAGGPAVKVRSKRQILCLISAAFIKDYTGFIYSIISSKWNPVPYLKDYQISSFSELFLYSHFSVTYYYIHKNRMLDPTIIIWFNQQQQINLCNQMFDPEAITTPTFSGDWR